MAQAALIKLMRQGKSEDELADLRPSYLWRVVHSEIMDELRRCRRRAEVGLEEVTGLADVNRPDVERTVAGRRTGDEIRSCLGLLVDSRRRVVALYLMGHKAREIAELLGISRKQAENLVFRGVRDLRRHLRERGYGHDPE
jgi:RNA polymerase sigma factor (sigma-70 family)